MKTFSYIKYRNLILTIFFVLSICLLKLINDLSLFIFLDKPYIKQCKQIVYVDYTKISGSNPLKKYYYEDIKTLKYFRTTKFPFHEIEVINRNNKTDTIYFIEN